MMHSSQAIFYENAIWCCVQARQWLRALRLLESMLHLDLELKKDVVHAVIETCAKAGQVQALEQMLAEKQYILDHGQVLQTLMQHMDEVPSQHQKAMFHLAYGIFKILRSSASSATQKPPLAVYQRMLLVAAHLGQWNRCLYFISDVQDFERVFVPFSSHNFIHLVPQTFKALEEAGPAIFPHDHERLFTSAMHACARVNEPDLAFRLYHEYEQTHGVPVAGSADEFYRSLIRVCQEKRTWHVGLGFFDQVQSSSMDPKVNENIMLLCNRTRQWQRTIDYYLQCMDEHVDSNNDNLPDNSKEHPHNLMMTSTSLSQLVLAYAKLGQDEDALEIFRSMKKDGLTPTSYAYARIMRIYSDKHQYHITRLLFEHLLQHHVPLNVRIYHELIFACLQCDDAQEAMESFKHMLSRGFEPDEWLMVDLLRAVEKHQGLVDQVWTISERYPKTRSSPELLNAMLIYHRQSTGNVDVFQKLMYADARRRGIRPNYCTFMLELFFQLRRQDFVRAHAIVDLLREASVKKRECESGPVVVVAGPVPTKYLHELLSYEYWQDEFQMSHLLVSLVEDITWTEDLGGLTFELMLDLLHPDTHHQVLELMLKKEVRPLMKSIPGIIEILSSDADRNTKLQQLVVGAGTVVLSSSSRRTNESETLFEEEEDQSVEEDQIVEQIDLCLYILRKTLREERYDDFRFWIDHVISLVPVQCLPQDLQQGISSHYTNETTTRR